MCLRLFRFSAVSLSWNRDRSSTSDSKVRPTLSYKTSSPVAVWSQTVEVELVDKRWSLLGSVKLSIAVRVKGQESHVVSRGGARISAIVKESDTISGGPSTWQESFDARR